MNTKYKVVFTGPVGSGKTTAIQTLSDIAVVQTEATPTDQVRLQKPATTVAMDYGLMKLASGEKVHLYGTPGQKRFDFMWDILTRDAHGLVLLINATAHDPIDDLRQFCKHFHPFIALNTLVVGVTHAEKAASDVAGALMDELRHQGAAPRVMDADARNRKHMALLVESLMFGMKSTRGA
jgi:hypothetical protein